jgi:plasmid stabilization system protein ParE
MAYKVIWSPAARDDLHDIVVFIGSMTAKQIVLETIRVLADNCSQEGAPSARHSFHQAIVLPTLPNLLSSNHERTAWCVSAAATK